ncbi:MAG TPA: hypothetical protein VND68_08155, partial [Chloroflexia bacterium]|nr:hypothetical protein [Chloroflexia bacterium]
MSRGNIDEFETDIDFLNKDVDFLWKNARLSAVGTLVASHFEPFGCAQDKLREKSRPPPGCSP